MSTNVMLLLSALLCGSSLSLRVSKAEISTTPDVSTTPEPALVRPADFKCSKCALCEKCNQCKLCKLCDLFSEEFEPCKKCSKCSLCDDCKFCKTCSDSEKELVGLGRNKLRNGR